MTASATGSVVRGVPRNEFLTRAPSPGLARYVALYSGYWQEGVAPATHRGLPSPYLTVIFTIEHPLRVAEHPDPLQTPSVWRALIGGLHLTPATIVHDGAQSGIQVMMTPLGARRMLGLPAGEIAGIDVEAADLLGAGAAEVCDRLGVAGDWATRFAIVDTFLCASAARTEAQRAMPPHLEAAWRLLRRSAGGATIASVADAVGASPRALRDGFGLEFGVTPKQAARIVRFDRTRRELAAAAAAGAPLALADLAAQRGYADQAHLTRDFAAFAGLPPGAWLSAELDSGNPVHDPEPGG